jgi:hypothetical protein
MRLNTGALNYGEPPVTGIAATAGLLRMFSSVPAADGAMIDPRSGRIRSRF